MLIKSRTEYMFSFCIKITKLCITDACFTFIACKDITMLNTFCGYGVDGNLKLYLCLAYWLLDYVDLLALLRFSTMFFIQTLAKVHMTI